MGRLYTVHSSPSSTVRLNVHPLRFPGIDRPIEYLTVYRQKKLQKLFYRRSAYVRLERMEIDEWHIVNRCTLFDCS